MTSGRYDVVSQTIEVLFSPGTAQFQVPVFQRRYAWGPEEISQLIDDIFGESTQSDLPYFLGSIVLARQDSGDALQADLVLDGQQRLTTISLTVAVLVKKIREEGANDADEHKMYLFSRRIKGKKTPKVLLQQEDAKVFERIINDQNLVVDSKMAATRIGAAVMKLSELLDEYRDSPHFRDVSRPFEAMLDRLLYDVELVRITAPSERDAFRLFETLNDRGLALSAADLIKNKLFSRCKEEIEDAIESWTSILNLTKEDDIVNFLRTYWVAFNGFARKRGLYDVYKDHIDRLGATEATLFVIGLEEAARLYEQIALPNPRQCTWGIDVVGTLERLSGSYRSRSCRPALLAFARSRPSEMERIANLCETITVRYSVVGEKNPNRLERLYAELCEVVRREGDIWASLAESAIFDEIPSDEEFRLKIASASLGTVTNGWREVLIQLNHAAGGGELRVDRPTRVHIEHVLPQSPRATALTEAGLTLEEAAQYSGRVGNLTLLSGRRNQELSNRPFSYKREVYRKSDVYLTREISSSDRWGGEEIEERSNWLAELAVKRFMHPRHMIANFQG